MASKILDEARDVMRRRHYSIRTEKSYIGWIKRHIKHYGMKSRNDLENGERKVEEFLPVFVRLVPLSGYPFSGTLAGHCGVPSGHGFFIGRRIPGRCPGLNCIVLSAHFRSRRLPGLTQRKQSFWP